MGQIVGGVAIDEVGAQPPHLLLGRPDEAGDGLWVASRGGGCEARQLIHVARG